MAIAALAVCGVALIALFTYDQSKDRATAAQKTAESLKSSDAKAQAAPPMPYRFVGVSNQDGKTRYLLEKDGRTLTVSPGTIIDRDYRLDVTDSQDVALVHLPTGVRQAVPMKQASWPPPTGSPALAEPTARNSSLPPGVAEGPGSPVRQIR